MVWTERGFPGGSDGKEFACSAGDPGSFPGLEISWRRKWQPTPVFLPGEIHGQRSLAGCSPWDRKELNTNQLLSLFHVNWSPLPLLTWIDTYRLSIFHAPCKLLILSIGLYWRHLPKAATGKLQVSSWNMALDVSGVPQVRKTRTQARLLTQKEFCCKDVLQNLKFNLCPPLT